MYARNPVHAVLASSAIIPDSRRLSQASPRILRRPRVASFAPLASTVRTFGCSVCDKTRLLMLARHVETPRYASVLQTQTPPGHPALWVGSIRLAVVERMKILPFKYSQVMESVDMLQRPAY